MSSQNITGDFRRLVDLYFRQLSQGCRNEQCRTPMCAGSLDHPLPIETCAALSVNMAASFGDCMLCPYMIVPTTTTSLIARSLLWWRPKPLMSGLSTFTASLLTTSPWRWLFGHSAPKGEKLPPQSLPQLIVQRTTMLLPTAAASASELPLDSRSRSSASASAAHIVKWAGILKYRTGRYTPVDRSRLLAVIDDLIKRQELLAAVSSVVNKRAPGVWVYYALLENLDASSIEAIKQHLTKQVTVAAHQQQQQEKKRPVLDVDKATLLLILLLREGSPSSQDVIAHISHDILNAWSQQDKVDLTARWATFEKDTFQELVYSFKLAFEAKFHPLRRPSISVVGLLESLKITYEANKLRLPHDRLSDGTFYSEVVNSQLDIRTEANWWISSISNVGMKRVQTYFPFVVSVTPSEERSSYLDYPFVFNARTKAIVIANQNLRKMSQQMTDMSSIDQWASKIVKTIGTKTRYIRLLYAEYIYHCSPYLVLTVSREALVQDALQQIGLKAMNIFKPLRVRFVDGGEEGVDQGGVQKEFFPQFFKLVLSPDHGLFKCYTESQLYWPRFELFDKPEDYESLGKVMGLAIYNGVHADLPLPLAFFKHLAGEPCTLNDLAELDHQLALGLQSLLEFDGDVQAVFCRTFATEGLFDYDSTHIVDLVENGANIAMTNENREQYVEAYVQAVMVKLVLGFFEPFKRGFWSVVGTSFAETCTAMELQRITCGNPAELSVAELEAIAQYDDGYTESHPTIEMFWSVVREMSPTMKRRLLQFVSASDRVPLQGMHALTFVIQRNGMHSDRLPSAQTCFGRLLLPEYNSKEVLQERLHTALNLCVGFGLA